MYSKQVAESYNQKWSRFSAATQEEVLGLLRENKIQPHSILDYGAGTGTLLRVLRDKYPAASLAAYEPSADMLDVLCREQEDLHIKTYTSEEILLESKDTFDLIVTTNALHYFDNPELVLVTLREFLNPGGHLLITDFSKKSFLPKYFEWYLHLIDKDHKKTYDMDDMLALMGSIPELDIMDMSEFDLQQGGWKGLSLLARKAWSR